METKTIPKTSDALISTMLACKPQVLRTRSQSSSTFGVAEEIRLHRVDESSHWAQIQPGSMLKKRANKTSRQHHRGLENHGQNYALAQSGGKV